MKFRLKAFGLHLAASTCALTLILGGLYLGWYRWPGWYLTGVLHVLDHRGRRRPSAGAHPDPDRRQPEEAAARARARHRDHRDGAARSTRSTGRRRCGKGGRSTTRSPWTRLEMVQASDLEAREIALGPSAKSRTRAALVQQAALDLGAATGQIRTKRPRSSIRRVFGAVRTWSTCRVTSDPWAEGAPQLREHLSPLSEIRYLSKAERQSLHAAHDQARVGV